MNFDFRLAVRGVSLLAAALIVAAQPAVAQDGSGAPGPRTFLETLDVSAPEATAGTFVAAYSRSDYFTAAFLFTLEAKTGFQSAMMSREGIKALFPASRGTVGSAAVHTLDGPFIVEQSLDFSVFFDDVMYQAETTGVLPFEIDPDAGLRFVQNEHGAIDVMVGDTVTLHLVQARPGRWLIDRISLPGLDRESRPW